jgi:hypothetical protein
MTRRTIPVLVCGLLILLAAAQGQDKQEAKDSGTHVESLMTAAEFKSCGLSKLTPDEIAHLDTWLASFANRIASGAGGNANAHGSSEVIESEIDGEFHGWDGQTIFKLANGQIWQQSEYDYEYEYAYRPEVMIYKTSAGYKMKVEDMEDTIYV